MKGEEGREGCVCFVLFFVFFVFSVACAQETQDKLMNDHKPTHEEWENVWVKKESMPSFLSKMVDETAFEAEVATQRSMTFYLRSLLLWDCFLLNDRNNVTGKYLFVAQFIGDAASRNNQQMETLCLNEIDHPG